MPCERRPKGDAEAESAQPIVSCGVWLDAAVRLRYWIVRDSRQRRDPLPGAKHLPARPLAPDILSSGRMQLNRRYQRMRRWCAEGAKDLPISKALAQQSSEMWLGRFRSGCSSDPAQAGLATLCDLCGLGGETFGLIATHIPWLTSVRTAVVSMKSSIYSAAWPGGSPRDPPR